MTPLGVGRLTVLSWNSCHKGKGSAAKLGKRLQSLGVDVALLQEVSRYGELRGKVCSGLAVLETLVVTAASG